MQSKRAERKGQFVLPEEDRIFNPSRAMRSRTARASSSLISSPAGSSSGSALSDAPGRIDPDARRLIEQSRRPRWRTLTLGGDKGTPALQFHFDAAGRYAYERTLSLGLHERVVCDGKTSTHLYPQLGLAARRTA